VYSIGHNKGTTTTSTNLLIKSKPNRLSMNYDKTNFMQFTTKNSPQIDLNISYANILTDKAYDTRFLGIYVVSTLYWKVQAEKLTHRLRAAFYAMRSVETFMSRRTLTMV